MAASAKAYLEVERGPKINCLFNPAELTLSQSNNWSSKPVAGAGVRPLEYSGAQSGSLSLTLFFDTTDTGDPVTKHTSRLQDLMKIDPQLPGYSAAKNNGRPPWVVFHWGTMHSFPAVVASLNLSFTYFSSSGVPLRAKAQMTLTQYKNAAAFGPQNPTSGTPNPHRVHRVQPGETLDRIAAHHYGDATRWRTLAEANAVLDPLAVRPGTLLAIPELEP